MTTKQTVMSINQTCYRVAARYISETGEFRITFRLAYLTEACGLSRSEAIARAEAIASYSDDSLDAIGTARHLESEGYR